MTTADVISDVNAALASGSRATAWVSWRSCVSHAGAGMSVSPPLHVCVPWSNGVGGVMAVGAAPTVHSTGPAVGSVAGSVAVARQFDDHPSIAHPLAALVRVMV